MNSISLLDDFRAVIADISESDALKYVKMGKGNLTLALNYYFNCQAKQRKLASQEGQKSAFAELMEGSKNQAKLEKIFNALKQDYSKPIESSIPANYTGKEATSHPDLKKVKTLDLNVGGFQQNTAKKEENRLGLEKTEPKDARKSTSFALKRNYTDLQNGLASGHKDSSDFCIGSGLDLDLNGNQRKIESATAGCCGFELPEEDKAELTGEKDSLSEQKTSNTLLDFFPSATKHKSGCFPRNIGKAIIKGYTLRSCNLAHLKKGDELYLKREKKVLLDENKKKKKTKPITNKGLNDSIIRVLTRNQEVIKD